MIVTFTILLISISVSPFAQTGNEFEVTDAYWTDTGNQRIDVTGGDTAYLTLDIRQSNPSNIEYTMGSSTVSLNKPPVAISGITVELENEDWFEILGDSSKDVGTTIPVGNTFTVSFYVKIKDGLPPGDYPGKVRISYTLAYDGDTWRVVNHSETVNFTITVTGKPDLKAEITGYINSGETNPINITITNQGDAQTSNSKIRLTSQSPLKIEPEEVDIGTLNPGETKTVTFNITAPYNYQQSVTAFTAILDYTSPSGLAKTQQWDLELISTEPPEDYPIIRVSLTTLQELIPNTPSPAILKIENQGQGKALNLYIKISSQAASIIPDTIPLLEELDPNEEYETQITITPSLQTAGTTIPIQVVGSYMDNKGQQHQVNIQFTVNVKSPDQYNPIITMSFYPAYEIVPGNKTIIYLKITNYGSTPAYNTTININGQGITITIPDRYIGTIPDGKTVMVPLIVDTPVTMRGQVLPVTILLTYKDVGGKSITIQNTMALKVTDEIREPKLVVSSKNKLTITTGEQKLRLYLTNNGDAPAKEVTIKVTATPGISVIGNSTIYIKQVNEKETIPLDLTISSDTPGSYILTIEMTYKDPWENESYDSTILGVKIIKKPDTTLQLYIPNNSIYGGKPGTLEMVVKAVDGNASDIWVKAAPIGISLVGTPVKYIPFLAENDTAIIKYGLYAPESLVGTASQFTITLDYITQQGLPRTESYQVSLLIKGEIRLELLDYNVYPAQPHPGDEIGITASIVNKGTDKAKQVTSYIIATGGLVLTGSNRTFIGNVDIGSIIPVSYSLKVPDNTSAMETSVTIKLVYQDSFNDEYTYDVTIPVKIFPPPIQEKPPFYKTYSTHLAIASVGIIAVIMVVLLYYKKLRKH